MNGFITNVFYPDIAPGKKNGLNKKTGILDKNFIIHLPCLNKLSSGQGDRVKCVKFPTGGESPRLPGDRD
jgi:hypothetical protein